MPLLILLNSASKIMFLHARPYRTSLLCLLICQSMGATGQTVAFLSDTQAPMWVEKLALKSNNNEEATGLIFNDIIAQRPASLFILGDVVNAGYKTKKWLNIDRYIDSCRSVGIKVSALLGNHDVMTRPRKGEAQFQRRFPDHNRTGFYLIADSVAVLFLNSNFSKMSSEDIRAQQTWYDKTLKAMDQDKSVVATIVSCHHAPYTNSKIVGPSQNVQKYFVPGYLASPKARLFITGHSHNFEWFKHGGKDFLVIGGGGGLSQPLNEKEDKLKDEATAYKPQFHYVRLQRVPGKLLFTSRYLKPDFSGLADGLTLTLSYR